MYLDTCLERWLDAVVLETWITGCNSKIFSDFTGQYKKYMNEIFSLHGYLDLFDPRSLESKIEAVVAEASYFCVISIIAHADDWDLGLLYQLYQFLFDWKKHTFKMKFKCRCNATQIRRGEHKDNSNEKTTNILNELHSINETYSRIRLYCIALYFRLLKIILSKTQQFSNIWQVARPGKGQTW